MKALCRILFSCLFLLATASSHACTVCNSANGRALRAGVFDTSFLHTFLLVMSPVPVLMVAVAILHFAMPDLSTAEPTKGRFARPELDRGLPSFTFATEALDPSCEIAS